MCEAKQNTLAPVDRFVQTVNLLFLIQRYSIAIDWVNWRSECSYTSCRVKFQKSEIQNEGEITECEIQKCEITTIPKGETTEDEKSEQTSHRQTR